MVIKTSPTYLICSFFHVWRSKLIFDVLNIRSCLLNFMCVSVCVCVCVCLSFVHQHSHHISSRSDPQQHPAQVLTPPDATPLAPVAAFISSENLCSSSIHHAAGSLSRPGLISGQWESGIFTSHVKLSVILREVRWGVWVPRWGVLDAVSHLKETLNLVLSLQSVNKSLYRRVMTGTDMQENTDKQAWR